MRGKDVQYLNMVGRRNKPVLSQVSRQKNGAVNKKKIRKKGCFLYHTIMLWNGIATWWAQIKAYRVDKWNLLVSESFGQVFIFQYVLMFEPTDCMCLYSRNNFSIIPLRRLLCPIHPGKLCIRLDVFCLSTLYFPYRPTSGLWGVLVSYGVNSSTVWCEFSFNIPWIETYSSDSDNEIVLYCM